MTGPRKFSVAVTIRSYSIEEYSLNITSNPLQTHGNRVTPPKQANERKPDDDVPPDEDEEQYDPNAPAPTATPVAADTEPAKPTEDFKNCPGKSSYIRV
jgi:hypothetical protein